MSIFGPQFPSKFHLYPKSVSEAVSHVYLSSSPCLTESVPCEQYKFRPLRYIIKAKDVTKNRLWKKRETDRKKTPKEINNVNNTKQTLSKSLPFSDTNQTNTMGRIR